MIKVTRMDGDKVYLNCEMIETIAETPDTHITLSNGNRYIVLESARVLISRIIDFKAKVLRKAAAKDNGDTISAFPMSAPLGCPTMKTAASRHPKANKV